MKRLFVWRHSILHLQPSRCARWHPAMLYSLHAHFQKLTLFQEHTISFFLRICAAVWFALVAQKNTCTMLVQLESTCAVGAAQQQLQQQACVLPSRRQARIQRRAIACSASRDKAPGCRSRSLPQAEEAGAANMPACRGAEQACCSTPWSASSVLQGALGGGVSRQDAGKPRRPTTSHVADGTPDVAAMLPIRTDVIDPRQHIC